MTRPPLSTLPPETPTPAAGWRATYTFVQRCRAWAVGEIAKRTREGRPTAEWEVYLRFTDHTLRELEDGTLDGWFDPAIPHAPPPG